MNSVKYVWIGKSLFYYCMHICRFGNWLYTLYFITGSKPMKQAYLQNPPSFTFVEVGSAPTSLWNSYYISKAIFFSLYW